MKQVNGGSVSEKHGREAPATKQQGWNNCHIRRLKKQLPSKKKKKKKQHFTYDFNILLTDHFKQKYGSISRFLHLKQELKSVQGVTERYS